MSKKKIGIVIGAIVGLVVMWFIYKAFLLHMYYYISWDTFDYDKSLGEVEISTVETTNSKTSILGADFVLPEGFVFDKEKTDKSESDTMIYSDTLGRVIITYFREAELSGRLEEVKRGINVSKILKKNHVSSMVDVMKYLDQHQKSKVTFLSSLEDIQTQYVMVMLSMMSLPNGEHYYITGDYDGYLIQQKNTVLLYLLHNDMVYEFSFHNPSRDATTKFTQADIVKFASAVTFE